MIPPLIHLERVPIEVGTLVRRRPSYRWTTGYYVVVNGVRTYPPERRNEAYRIARYFGHKGRLKVVTNNIPTEILRKALDVKVDSSLTIRGYFRILLTRLWVHKEKFSSARPFGYDVWKHDLYAALIRAGLVYGRLGSAGEVEHVDEAFAEDLLYRLIEFSFTPEAYLPDLEATASQVHAAWVLAKQEAGVTSRPSESGEEQMVPYEQLSEPIKDLDRTTVRAVYDAIRSVKN